MRWAMAFPIPDPAPVTSTRLPRRVCMASSARLARERQTGLLGFLTRARRRWSATWSMTSSARLLELIGLAYDAAVDPEQWSAWLTARGPAPRAPALGVFPVVPGSFSTRASLSVGHEPEFIARYDAYYGRPEVNAYVRWATPDMLVPGTVMRAEAVIPDRQLHRTEDFGDSRRTAGLRA